MSGGERGGGGVWGLASVGVFEGQRLMKERRALGGDDVTLDSLSVGDNSGRTTECESDGGSQSSGAIVGVRERGAQRCRKTGVEGGDGQVACGEGRGAGREVGLERRKEVNGGAGAGRAMAGGGGQRRRGRGQEKGGGRREGAEGKGQKGRGRREGGKRKGGGWREEAQRRGGRVEMWSGKVGKQVWFLGPLRGFQMDLVR